MTSGHTRVLVTGGTGRLGSELRAYFPLAYYPSHSDLDVRHIKSVNRWFSRHSVDLVIHGAAATHHDATLTDLIHDNIIGSANIALAAHQQSARLVLTSTDYVYPGTMGGYKETDSLFPVNSYAWSKLGAEASAQIYPNSLVIRGSWYSTLPYVRAATDAFCSKMPVAQAAYFVAALACSNVTGVVNIGGPRRSLFEIVASEFRPTVEAVSYTQMAAKIPPDVSLNCTKSHSILQ